MIRKKISFFYLLVFVTSCIQVQFENPQPLKSKALTSFPDEITGDYFFGGSKDTVRVSSLYFSFKELKKDSFPVYLLDSMPGIKVKDSLIYFPEHDKEKGYPFSIKNDSVFYKVFQITKVPLGKDLVLKKFKGSYIVNWRMDSAYWDIAILSLQKNGNIIKNTVEVSEDKNEADSLVIRQKDSIRKTASKELEELSRITKFKKIGEDHYLINPSKKEFELLIKNGLFSQQDTLFKIH